LVLREKLVSRPATARSALLAQAAQTHNDLQSGLSALGEEMSELRVPGNQPQHPTG